MKPDIPETAFNLSDLVEAIAAAEHDHRLHIPLREDFNHTPIGCTCGEQFEDGWSDARRHLREAHAEAVIQALRRPCETCHGSGTWRKMTGLLTCPDCDGLGVVLTPLPPMLYRDRNGQVWSVETTGDEDETGARPARVWPADQ